MSCQALVHRKRIHSGREFRVPSVGQLHHWNPKIRDAEGNAVTWETRLATPGGGNGMHPKTAWKIGASFKSILPRIDLYPYSPAAMQKYCTWTDIEVHCTPYLDSISGFRHLAGT